MSRENRQTEPLVRVLRQWNDTQHPKVIKNRMTAPPVRGNSEGGFPTLLVGKGKIARRRSWSGESPTENQL